MEPERKYGEIKIKDGIRIFGSIFLNYIYILMIDQ